MFSTVIYNVFRFCFYVFQISFNCLRTQTDLSGWVKRTLRSNVCALTNNLARTTVIYTTGLAPTVYKVKYGVRCWRQCHPCNVCPTLSVSHPCPENVGETPGNAIQFLDNLNKLYHQIPEK